MILEMLELRLDYLFDLGNTVWSSWNRGSLVLSASVGRKANKMTLADAFQRGRSHCEVRIDYGLGVPRNPNFI